MIPELELELSKKINKYNCKNIIQKYIYIYIFNCTYLYHIYNLHK